MSSLLRSNRYGEDNIKPEKSASINDLDSQTNQDDKAKQDNNVKKDAAPKIKEYRTSMNISNTTRNRLQSMVMIGGAETQKEAIDVLMDLYYDNLTKEKRQMFDFMYKSISEKDRKEN